MLIFKYRDCNLEKDTILEIARILLKLQDLEINRKVDSFSSLYYLFKFVKTDILVELTKLMLSRNDIDVNITSELSEPAIYSLIRCNESPFMVKAFKLMLDKIDPNKTPKIHVAKYSLFMYFCKYNKIDNLLGCFDDILRLSHCEVQNINFENKYGMTAFKLLFVCNFGNLTKIVDKFLKNETEYKLEEIEEILNIYISKFIHNQNKKWVWFMCF